MRIAIVGCGLIGGKRLRALAGDDALVVAVDRDPARACQLAAQFPGAATADDWRAAVGRADVDAVVVATTNDALAPVTLAALRVGKHVLVEKPAARNVDELRPVAAASREAFEHSGVVAKVGFNHRFHPALLKARELVDAGAIGPLMYVRGRYGHGGRPGMEKEWRGDPRVAGGGEMLDQGVHLVDLARWFLGDFPHVNGHVTTDYWDWPVEDNGFALLRTAEGRTAMLHASCSEWKNLFSFEIYGRSGKLAIDGLGGSYGIERIAFYQMLPEMGPPATTIWEYPGEDRSWHAEWAHFKQCVAERKQPTGNLDDAIAALDVIGRLYDLSGVKRGIGRY